MTRVRGLLHGFNWREANWVGLASLGFAAVFAYPLLCPVGYLGPGIWGWLNLPPELSHLARFPSNGDWDLFTELRWVPYYTVVHFRELPFWNPYRCGGTAMLGNPESGIITPFFLLYLWFGVYAGLYLEIFLHLATAFAGGYLLARVMDLTRPAALVCASAFPASSWLYLHLAVGHLNFLPAAYLPWVIALLIVAVERKSLLVAAIGGLVCALTFTEGNYTFLYTGIMVAIVSLALAVSHRSVRPALTGVMLGIFAAGFAALKLVPAWELLTIHPRPPFGPEYDDLKLMSVYLFSRNQDLYRVGASVFLLSEYGAYLSPAFAVLGLLGIFGARLRSLPWLAGAVLFFLLAQGDGGRHSALALLYYLPLTRQIDLPAWSTRGWLVRRISATCFTIGSNHCRRPRSFASGLSPTPEIRPRSHWLTWVRPTARDMDTTRSRPPLVPATTPPTSATGENTICLGRAACSRRDGHPMS
jgi:hypothetical protein